MAKLARYQIRALAIADGPVVSVDTTNTLSLGGDIKLTGTGDGMLLTAPNGDVWKVTISNTGVLTAVKQ